jgi:hypothetical protein
MGDIFANQLDPSGGDAEEQENKQKKKLTCKWLRKPKGTTK